LFDRIVDFIGLIDYLLKITGHADFLNRGRDSDSQSGIIRL